MTSRTVRRGHHRSRRILLLSLPAVALLTGSGWAGTGVAVASPGGAAAATEAPSAVPAANDLIVDVAAGQKLNGLFRLTAGSCAAGPVTGTYFRMIQPGGTVASGPYMQNTGTSCPDKTYTALRPGTQGGLSTVAYQPQPDPPFDSSGGGANDKITQPEPFYGAKFAPATNPVDPQTGIAVPVPVVSSDGTGKLSGDLRAFAAAYQGQHFNQGAPKPDGSTPGATTLASGTYNPATKAFSLQWASTIIGGPFDKFTGVWHLEGSFEPAPSTPPVTGAPAPATTSAGSAPASRAAAGTTSVSASTPAAPGEAARAATSSPAAGRTAAAAGRPGPGIPSIPSTGLRFPLSLPATLIGLGGLARILGRWPSRARRREEGRS